jgi:hypothetical protein
MNYIILKRNLHTKNIDFWNKNYGLKQHSIAETAREQRNNVCKIIGPQYCKSYRENANGWFGNDILSKSSKISKIDEILQ